MEILLEYTDFFCQSDLKSLDFLGTNCLGGYYFASIGDETKKYKCQCDKTSKYVLACEDDQDSIIIKVITKELIIIIIIVITIIIIYYVIIMLA